MGDQLAKVESHLLTRIAHAHLASVPGALQRQMQAAAFPGVAQLVQRHGHGAESRGRLALEEAKALGQLIGNQVAQADVIDQHHQTNAVQRILGIGAHGHITGDHGNLGLEVNAHGRAGHDHIVAGADEVIAAALVHQRVGVEVGGHFGVARLAHQLYVVDIGRAIGPLIGAWQRSHATLGIERKSVAGLAAVEFVRQILQLGCHIAPVVEHLLHAVGNACGIAGHAQIARDDNQLPIARTIFVSCQFHALLPVMMASYAGTTPELHINYDWLNQFN